MVIDINDYVVVERLKKPFKSYTPKQTEYNQRLNGWLDCHENTDTWIKIILIFTRSASVEVRLFEKWKIIDSV